MSRVVIISDVRMGDINGVATWLANIKNTLEKNKSVVTVIDNSCCRFSPSLPGYQEVRLGVCTPHRMTQMIAALHPDSIHIATEGTLGLAARRACIKNNWAFTTTYHTKFPEYVYARTHMRRLESAVYAYMRWFHRASERVHVSTRSLRSELESQGFTHLSVVPLGVDTERFSCACVVNISKKKTHPVFIYIGRIAIEKNVEAFLQCKLPGQKVLVGDGPQRKELEKKYAGSAMFMGYLSGIELVQQIARADVCVFTSRTDTFGLSIIEALACGVPVAAFDVPGPRDILTHGIDGYMGDDLALCALECLRLSSQSCRATAERYSWQRSADVFLHSLVPRQRS
jgi:glycosyltransferase involved in cell wall biosynthesis